MDSCVVLPAGSDRLDVVEARNLKKGDRVLLGRTEHGRGRHIRALPRALPVAATTLRTQFVFRQGRSRETSYAKDYDQLTELLQLREASTASIVWVMGPAFAFDRDARRGHAGHSGKRLRSRPAWRATPWLPTTWRGLAFTPPSVRTSTPRNPCQTATTTIWTCLTWCAAQAPYPQFVEEYRLDNGIMVQLRKE